MPPPAPLKPVAGVAKVAFNGTLGNVNVANVMHVGAELDNTAWSQAQMDALATGMRGLYVTHFCPLITSNYSLLEVVATDLSTNEGLSSTMGGTTAGSQAGSVTPANVAVGITWKQRRRFRGGHFRTYLPPPGTATYYSTSNTWSAAAVTAYTAAALAFRTGVASLNPGARACQLVAVSRVQDDQWLDPPFVYAITSQGVDTRMDSQRRRLGKDRPA